MQLKRYPTFPAILIHLAHESPLSIFFEYGFGIYIFLFLVRIYKMALAVWVCVFFPIVPVYLGYNESTSPGKWPRPLKFILSVFKHLYWRKLSWLRWLSRGPGVQHWHNGSIFWYLPQEGLPHLCLEIEDTANHLLGLHGSVATLWGFVVSQSFLYKFASLSVWGAFPIRRL